MHSHTPWWSQARHDQSKWRRRHDKLMAAAACWADLWWLDSIEEQVLINRLRSVLQQCWWEWWADDQQYWPAAEQIEETDDVDVTVSFNCKSKLVLLLRLWYLKPFLAGSKKTRHGPGWKIGALCISKCWFYLTVVAVPKTNTKRLQNHMVLCSLVLWFLLWLHDSDAYDL